MDFAGGNSCFAKYVAFKITAIRWEIKNALHTMPGGVAMPSIQVASQSVWAEGSTGEKHWCRMRTTRQTLIHGGGAANPCVPI